MPGWVHQAQASPYTGCTAAVHSSQPAGWGRAGPRSVAPTTRRARMGPAASHASHSMLAGGQHTSAYSHMHTACTVALQHAGGRGEAGRWRRPRGRSWGHSPAYCASPGMPARAHMVHRCAAQRCAALHWHRACGGRGGAHSLASCIIAGVGKHCLACWHRHTRRTSTLCSAAQLPAGWPGQASTQPAAGGPTQPVRPAAAAPPHMQPARPLGHTTGQPCPPTGGSTHRRTRPWVPAPGTALSRACVGRGVGPRAAAGTGGVGRIHLHLALHRGVGCTAPHAVVRAWVH